MFLSFGRPTYPAARRGNHNYYSPEFFHVTSPVCLYSSSKVQSHRPRSRKIALMNNRSWTLADAAPLQTGRFRTLQAPLRNWQKESSFIGREQRIGDASKPNSQVRGA